MNKWFLFSMCLLFGVALSPLQAGEAGSSPPESVREQVDCSVWINGEFPRLAPVYFTGAVSRRGRWEVDILSFNGYELPVPVTIALKKEPAGFSPARETPCCGIIPVLVPSGTGEEPRRWRDAGASPAVVMEYTPRALSLLQEAVLQSYQHHLMKSLHMAAGILDRMTDEEQALKLEKNWAYETMDCIFWILLEGSVPMDARMAYIKRHPDMVEQSQKATDACQERLRLLQGKPWSGQLRLLKREFETPLPSPDGARPAVPGFKKQESGS